MPDFNSGLAQIVVRVVCVVLVISGYSCTLCVSLNDQKVGKLSFVVGYTTVDSTPWGERRIRTENVQENVLDENVYASEISVNE